MQYRLFPLTPTLSHQGERELVVLDEHVQLDAFVRRRGGKLDQQNPKIASP